MTQLLVWFLFLVWPLSLAASAGSARSQQTQDTPDLETAVTEYWELLQKGDKAGALRHVHPDDLNHFIRRTEGSFSDWKVKAIAHPSPDSAVVTVSVQRLLMNSRVPQEITETWVQTADGWKVRVPRPLPIVERVRARARELAQQRLPETLEIFPAQLRFYALSPRQPAAITIRNGLHEEVQVEALQFDKDRLQILSPLESVAPRSSGRILLGLHHPPAEPNQTSQVQLTLKVAGETRTFQIPVVMNYVDDITRWVAGQPHP
jgi:hypothetical protein